MPTTCGFKRPFMEEFSPLPVVSKKLCRSPPALWPQFHPPITALVDLLQERNSDLDTAIKRLHDIWLGSSASATIEESILSPQKKFAQSDDGGVTPGNPSALLKNLLDEGVDFIELLVKILANAKSVEDVKDGAAKLLRTSKKTVVSWHANAMAESLGRENSMQKEQVEKLRRENTVLKRAVVIQHERHQDKKGDKDLELKILKELVPHHMKQLRKLEVKNHALHWKAAQRKDSVRRIFHPNVL